MSFDNVTRVRYFGNDLLAVGTHRSCLDCMYSNLLPLADKKMVPIENYGVKCMSIGLLVEKDAPLVWRGPMV